MSKEKYVGPAERHPLTAIVRLVETFEGLARVPSRGGPTWA